jgi:hypothetical protein
MENLDLDIENYSLNDILNLFNLTETFDETDLKNAKKKVLMTHPDKSNLDSDVFLFFAKAYKYLLFINDFRHRTNKTIREDLDGNKEDAAFIAKIREKKDFHKVFNELFEEHKMRNAFQEKGYEAWLTSDEGVSHQTHSVKNMTDMREAFYEEKRRAKDIVKYNGVEDMIDTSQTDLSGQAPQHYGSSLFSKLQYEDVKIAHSETVIPVSEQDYDPSKQFKTVTQLQAFRGCQDMTPMTDQQSRQYLHDKEELEKRESAKRAYMLAKQMEEAQEKNKHFMSKFKYLQ